MILCIIYVYNITSSDNKKIESIIIRWNTIDNCVKLIWPSTMSDLALVVNILTYMIRQDEIKINQLIYHQSK